MAAQKLMVTGNYKTEDLQSFNQISFFWCLNMAWQCNMCGFFAPKRKHTFETIPTKANHCSVCFQTVTVPSKPGMPSHQICRRNIELTRKHSTDKSMPEVICFKCELYSLSLSTEEDCYCRVQYSTNVYGTFVSHKSRQLAHDSSREGYWLLANVSPQIRSTLKLISNILGALCKAVDVNKYNYEAVLEPLLKDSVKLERSLVPLFGKSIKSYSILVAENWLEDSWIVFFGSHVCRFHSGQLS